MSAVAVTGTSGMVGSACARDLASRGHAVLALKRSGLDAASVRFELGRDVDPAVLRGVDALVHCAYDFDARTWDEIQKINVAGSIKLLRAASDAGVKKIIFISSVSAFDGCRSMYGRGKLLVEVFAREIGGIVVRPGLVYGAPGGMHGALEKAARLPVIPVFDGGRQPFVLVHADDLARALEALVSKDVHAEKTILTAAHPAPIAFIDLLRRIAARQGRAPAFFSIPGALGLSGLKAAEFLGLRLGFRSDSMLSLLYGNPRMNFDLPEEFDVRFRAYPD